MEEPKVDFCQQLLLEQNDLFYPYSQIIRKNIPKDIVNFFILHEGPLGVFNDTLK